MFAFIAVPVMAHDDTNHPVKHPVNEAVVATDRNNDGDTTDPGEEAVAAHNAHPVPTIDFDDDGTTVTDNKKVEGVKNRVRIVEVANVDATNPINENTLSRTFTLLVDYDLNVVGVSSLQALDFNTADPPEETTDSIPDLAFETLVLDTNGTVISNGVTVTGVRKANEDDAKDNSMFELTVVVDVTAIPDGFSNNGTTTPDGLVTDPTTLTAAPNLEEITVRIRVNATADAVSTGVFSLATRPGFDVVPGGRSIESNLIELTLVDDLGEDPVPSLDTITAGSINDKNEVVFTIAYDRPLLDTQSFRLGDIASIEGGRAVDFEADPDGKTFRLTVEADDPEERITVTIGEGSAAKSATSDPAAIEEETVELDIRVEPPVKPDAEDKLVFTITSTAPFYVNQTPAANELTVTLSINDFDINTEEVDPLTSGDLVETDDDDLSPGIAVEYKLTVTPKSDVTSVLVELRAGVGFYDHDGDTTTPRVRTPGAEGRYSPEEVKPVIEITAVNNDDSGLAATPGEVDSVDGATITIAALDVVGLASGAEVVAGEVTIENGSMMAGSFTKGATATFTVIPDIGATTVTVTVAKDAVKDGADNGNAVASMEFTVGPIFNIPANTILVITKTQTPNATHGYLSDQPFLPINQQPPTIAANFSVDTWHNMPDLEVLFSLTGDSNGGTLNLIEADGQAELEQTRDGGDDENDSVRISEVMWAADESKRGGVDDAEAAEQWIEVSNDTGDDVSVFLYARTGLDSAINLDGSAEDRVGNAYNGGIGNPGWPITSDGSGKGQNGNSYTGVDFVSMHRKYETDKSRGYVRGTDAGNWSASGTIYRTNPTGNPNDGALYHYKGSPGRQDSIPLPTPNEKADSTGVPSNKVIINEVANRDDANKAYEWIELHAPGGEVNLRKYVISVVTGVNQDNVLIDFPNDDNAKIPAGGVLLLLASDPRFDDNHPIAVGYNVDEPNADQVAGLGLNVADSPRAPANYKVIDFKGNGLPDGGNFLLIVRRPDDAGKNDGPERGKDDLDKIEDVAGYHTGLDAGDSGDVEYPDGYPATNPKNLNTTDMWPLVNAPRPGFVHNRFDTNTVHHRNRPTTNKGFGGTRAVDDKGGGGEAAYGDPGYSGIGYKRWVRDIGSIHHGTPGYDDNVVNTVANSSVTISEIMYSTGANGQLPQWIELYNSSATKAVYLGDGWRIVIETLDADGNALSNLLTINFKDKDSVKYIYPQQTVLIAAGNARQAGSDFQPASVVFPDNRLFNVSKFYSGDGALKSGDEFANDRYMFFNPKAFHLALLDKDGKLVDEIGNLDGDVRTNDTVTPDAEFPSAVGDDGVRSSIIRIYDDGVARTGSGVVPMKSEDGVRIDKNADGVANADDIGMGIDPKYAWIPAVNTGTEFKITIRSTWYGDEDDYGTPGHRRGLVLPVQLSFFRPTLEDGVVTIRWTTESELDNAGFNIYRSEERDGEYKQVNTELIDGAGTTGERSNYSWVDQTAKPGVVYYYQIEDVSFAGDREALAVTKLKGLISAKNKLTTTWSELKEASQ